jgi:glycosyltransferase involved in cell wall biosynthesis
MTPPSPRLLHPSSTLGPDVGIIVHSHLRWDFVWQRPQQLLSRLAATNPVLFVEEPVCHDDGRCPSLELTTPAPNLVRAVPQLPRDVAARDEDAFAAIRQLVGTALRRGPLAGRFQRVVQWFYTPMPAPAMLGAFGEDVVVYDCMDELAQFRFAPEDIGRRERILLSRADVVFTGGQHLFDSKSRYHDNVHFFGCGVDAAHFGSSRASDTVIPEDAERLPGPVIGYYGVIDERLDYALIRALAESHPEWTVVMIGPVVKVDPADLPQAPNLHWLGQKSYADLPRYLKAFDVCLMPFALNEATEYINPTKTLEYMASGKPIVSTPVPDVLRNHASVVRIAPAGEGFLGEVAAALQATDDARLARGLERAAQASWESIVRQMRGLIAEALDARLAIPRIGVPAATRDAAVASGGAIVRPLGRAAAGIDLAPGSSRAIP